MKIIDFRFRPPYRDFLKEGQTIYDPRFSIPFAAQYGARIPESALKKSMELACREMDENDIVKAVVPVRVCQGGTTAPWRSCSGNTPIVSSGWPDSPPSMTAPWKFL